MLLSYVMIGRSMTFHQYVRGENFTVDHAMICKRRGFVIRRHNELRDLEADLLSMVLATSGSSQFSKTSLKNSSVEGPIEHKTQDWTFGRVASGIPRALHSLM